MEGYQTFDTIAAIVVGAVIIISINLKEKEASFEEKRKLIRKAGFWAGVGLFSVYAGLILTGALFSDQFEGGISRTSLLSELSIKILGGTGSILLSILVSLACFTTAVGVITGTADFIKGRFNNSDLAYKITALVSCVFGVLMGQFNVDYIIAVAIPSLMFIYPITIILILLNVLPDRLTTPTVFKTVVWITILFSVPDFLGSMGLGETITPYISWIPFSAHQLGWVLPALLALALSNVIQQKTKIA
mgnify:CR=1 FL=1